MGGSIMRFPSKLGLLSPILDFPASQPLCYTTHITTLGFSWFDDYGLLLIVCLLAVGRKFYKLRAVVQACCGNHFATDHNSWRASSGAIVLSVADVGLI
jgi:hypothetical protein